MWLQDVLQIPAPQEPCRRRSSSRSGRSSGMKQQGDVIGYVFNFK
jgi:hypothetical protein